MTDYTKSVKARALPGIEVEIKDRLSDYGAFALCPKCRTRCRVPIVGIDEPVVCRCAKCNDEFKVAEPAYKLPEREAWVMLIDEATEEQVREVGRLCGSVGVTGRFVRGDINRAFYKVNTGIEKGVRND